MNWCVNAFVPAQHAQASVYTSNIKGDKRFS